MELQRVRLRAVL